MIIDDQIGEGLFEEKVYCGNRACAKLLSTHRYSKDYPAINRPIYLLASIGARILFVGRSGQPLSTPLWFQGIDDLVSFMVQLDGRAVGYNVVPGSKVLMEDFCSDQC